ncbi:MAG: hypothetical protein JW776_12430 [Candidatus Lokiarchaeota archaeon]|nr:hypothetical protein [Candidatus Lokiarchaeota archaeon]
MGIWNSVLMNLAQAMERHGIVIFDKKTKSHASEYQSEEKKGKKPLIYTIGVILNQTPPLWIMISNIFAPFTYFTSMYGIGLIVLLIYSAKILNEKLTTRKIVGAAILILGTITLGIDGILQPELDMSEINIISSSIFVGGLAVLAIILIPTSLHTKKPKIIGICFGFICGSFQSLDPVIKGIGQSFGAENTGFFPSTPIGWIIFSASFLAATISFLLAQVGFSKKTDASVQVPVANSSFIIIPILIQAIALPGYYIKILTIIGVTVVISGILLMQVHPFVASSLPSSSISKDSL